jgi:predicted DNA binding CopG/RHH family protein
MTAEGLTQSQPQLLFICQTHTRTRKKVLKPLAHFASEDEESDFWDTHDSTDYIDWSKAERGLLFPNLKPSFQTISLRLPAMMLAQLKTLASKRDVPYQSLLKIFLAERLEVEFKHTPGRPVRRRAATQ